MKPSPAGDEPDAHLKGTLISALKRGLGSMPLQERLVGRGALLPPALKIPSVTRILRIMNSTLPLNSEITTNLGIAGEGYRIVLPRTASDIALFGTPMQYFGERGPLALARALCDRSDAFLDVGAHIGYFVFFVRGRGASLPIFYFEPNRTLFDCIEKNVRRNELGEVRGFCTAVGATSGRSKFYLDLTDPLSSSLTTFFAPQHQVSEIDVDVITIRDFLETRSYQRLCVKVDVEAAEFQFLEGCEGVLDRLAYLIIELLGPAIQAGFVPAAISKGFHAYYINDFELVHSTEGSFQYVAPQYNWLFCREEPGTLKQLLAGAGLDVR